MRRHARLLICCPKLLPVWAALQGEIGASGPALRAVGVVVLVSLVGVGPVGRGSRHDRWSWSTAAWMRRPIHVTFGTAQLLPSAL